MAFTDLYIRLQDIAQKLNEQMPDAIAAVGMAELEAEWKDRVFGEGQMPTGAPIGTYSTEAAYFTRKSFIRAAAFRPQGKKSTSATFKNGNRRKSMYLPGGYNELRDIQGRQTPEVNLKYSGSMERAFRVYKFGDAVLFGNADEAEHRKVRGTSEKYGEWTALSQTELEMLVDSIGEQAVIIAAK